MGLVKKHKMVFTIGNSVNSAAWVGCLFMIVTAAL